MYFARGFIHITPAEIFVNVNKSTAEAYDEAIANANLIIAAKDMLAACEIARQEHQDLCMTLDNCPFTKRLDAAIAKARGVTE